MNRGSRSGITSSVFNLLAIDPLAGLDPATRELANTRLFAERGYVPGSAHADLGSLGKPSC